MRRFSHGCCVDASAVLSMDNHMWVDCDRIGVDITYGKDEALYLQKVFITDEPPYLNKSGYKINRHEPIKTELGQYIKEMYVNI
ncbi:hypothetical protein [Clostridium estertheticum]|uniref:hypothetical protein n=2 Tax=Clostridium estertheticum TaxID=238834 RepID=UPI002714B8DF|nr:hypothetical protein [Clostridium estertheticum]WLC79162.1 hypothetical protein KTC98_18565 [Clostridium estertheticum]